MIINPSEIRALIHVATRRTGTPVHDEDLEQDVALHALEAFQRLHEVTHPRGLLMKIVHDSVRDYWRRKRSSEELATIDERFISHAPAFESNLDHKRRLELLRRSLDRLPAAKRRLLELFYVKGQSIPEIAALQGRSISAVKMELARSRQLLARIFFLLLNKKCSPSAARVDILSRKG
jgi:RNA polymerase sigma factor (sigma-70 family)